MDFYLTPQSGHPRYAAMFNHALSGILTMKTKILILVLVGFSTARLAAPGEVPEECRPWPLEAPWRWTNEERLEKRFDERCLVARRTVAANRQRRDGSCTSSGNITDFVFGTDTPELFMPWELFDTLLRKVVLAKPSFSEGQRLLFEQHVRTANLSVPAHFWQEVETSASEYIRILREQQEMASGLESASPGERRKVITDVSASQRANCALRAAALERVRAAFEQGVFDQLLYVAAAPGLCSSGSGDRAMKL